MRYDEPRVMWTSLTTTHTSERGGKGLCVKGGWREEGERVRRGEVCQEVVVVYYCSSKYNALRGGELLEVCFNLLQHYCPDQVRPELFPRIGVLPGPATGWVIVEDMYYERRRAEACVVCPSRTV
jgi:hypothetical protein